MLACTAINCCKGVPAVGLLGFSVNPLPWRKSLQPALLSSASDSRTTAFLFILEFLAFALVVECNGHDPPARQRRIEPIDPAVRVQRAAEIGFWIEAAVVRPQRQV